MSTFFGWLLSFTAVLLIIVVLIQRGRGGGLAGALGGGGGQSAFGSKAGDLFTKITFGLATFWIVLCCVTLKMLSASSSSKFSGVTAGEQTAPASPGETAPSTPVPSKTIPAEKVPSGATTTGAAAPSAGATGPAKSSGTVPAGGSTPAVPPATPAGK